MKELFFEERGIAYRVNEFQEGKPTLVFIHGLSGSASAWYPFEKLFSDYNVLTFDLRGHGRSARPRRYEDYELPIFAQDLHELLVHVDITSCSLVSHSFGSLVALEYLLRHQDKVSSVVFLSPSTFLKETHWYGAVKSVGSALVALGRVLPFRTTMRGRFDYATLGYTTDWDSRRIIRDVYLTTLHAYFYCLSQAYKKDYDPLWKQISKPTLIVHGTLDEYIPLSHSRRLHTEIVGSELVTIEGANHLIVINNIPDVEGAIRSFLLSHVPVQAVLPTQATQPS